jgi:hypothetical protein
VGFGYLNISVNGHGNTGFIYVLINWSTTQDGLSIADTAGFTVGPATETTLQYPAIARYVKIQVVPANGVGTDSPRVEIFGSNVYAPNSRTQQYLGPLISSNSAVAAGATLTVAAQSTYEGPATVHFADDGNNKWFATAEWNNGGPTLWQRFLLIVGADNGQGFTQQINLPPTPVRLSITNQDTVAHGMYVELVT